MQQQLDQLSTIGRCEYEKTCALLVQLFDQAAQSYQELLQSTNSNAVDITVQEGMSSAHGTYASRSRFSAALTGAFVCRSSDVAGVYNRGRDRRTGVIC